MAGPTLRLRRELLLLSGLYAGYALSRALGGSDPAGAARHAELLLAAEAAVGLDVEGALSRAVAASSAASVVTAYAYALLHYTVTPAVLLWLWRRHPAHYAGARTALLAATGVALVCYWLLPVAPPRLLSPEFPDVLALTADIGWWGAEASAPRGLGGLTNQYAALPSMHVGWAVWCGLFGWRLGRSRVARVAALAYPLVVTVVVVATANHWVVDAVAGAAVVLLAVRLTAGRAPAPAAPPPPAVEPAAGQLPVVPAQPGRSRQRA